MAKFVYRLQNVLNIKYKMESQAKTAYAAARQHLNDEQDKLEQMIVYKKVLEDKYRDSAKGMVNVKELAENKRSIDYQREIIKNQLVEVKVAEKNLEMARIRLNDVMKDRKTHEKLKEKAFEEFMVELGEEEKKEIDELVSYRFGTGNK